LKALDLPMSLLPQIISRKWKRPISRYSLAA
jgi:hypothetical protein